MGVRPASLLVLHGESRIRHDRQLCLEMFSRPEITKFHAVKNILHVGMKTKVHIKSYKIEVFRL